MCLLGVLALRSWRAGERRPNSVPVRAGEIAIPPLCLKALLAGGRVTTCTASSLVLGHL